MKNKKYLVVGAAVVLVIFVLFVGLKSDKSYISEIERPDMGEDCTVYPLNMEIDGEEVEVEVPVEAETIDKENLQLYFEEAYEILFEKIRGDNASYDEILTDLDFCTAIDKFGMKVEYELSDYEIIDVNGVVNNENLENSYEDTLTVRICYEEMSQEYEIRLKVLPRPKSEQEIWNEKVKNSIVGNSDKVILPDSIDGKVVRFSGKKTGGYKSLIILPIIAGVVWYYFKFYKPKKAGEEVEMELREDYSEIVSKLSLLMGAGMSGSKAFVKLAEDYNQKIDIAKPRKRAAYEEINRMVKLIENGVAEEDAYESFGRACRNHSYIKLANLMTQNVKKGGAEFNSILKAEVSNAFTERKALARQRGEKAGTKLLLPMIMMLSIVLIIILVPAFMSF